MNHKAILVEDEPNAIHLLKGMIRDYVPSVEILGEARNVPEAITLIGILKPNLVFLDLELTGKEGWQVLDYFRSDDFRVIVTTAHEHHALRSYQYGVVDYLLKPLTPANLKNAVSKVEKHFSVSSQSETNNPIAEIKIQTSTGYRYVAINRIVRLEAARNYTWLHLVADHPVLLSKTLATLEEQLAGHGFLRIHHSHLVNQAFAHFFERNTRFLTLTEGTELPVSRERKKVVQEYFARK